MTVTRAGLRLPGSGRGLSCVANLNRFKVTSLRGQRYGDFLMQKHTLLFEVVCGVITIGIMFSLMLLLGLTT